MDVFLGKAKLAVKPLMSLSLSSLESLPIDPDLTVLQYKARSVISLLRHGVC